MPVFILATFKADKKEPFGAMVKRLGGLLAESGISPDFEFEFTDLLGGSVSAVERAVKKQPQLGALVRNSVVPGLSIEGPPQIYGREGDLELEDLATLGDGIPRTYPFGTATVRWAGPEFGPEAPVGKPLGLQASDRWWISGRQRDLLLGYVQDAPGNVKKLPPLDGPLGALLAALGKPKSVNQFPTTESASPLLDLQRGLREQIRAVGERHPSPHSLPELAQALASRTTTSFPLKPTLERFFGPLGYSIVGGSGIFRLRWKTTAGNVLELYLDVGTWSRAVSAQLRIFVPGHQAMAPLPVASGIVAPQYPIGEPSQWDAIVENLSALMTVLATEIAPVIDERTGPAPAWWEPNR